MTRAAANLVCLIAVAYVACANTPHRGPVNRITRIRHEQTRSSMPSVKPSPSASLQGRPTPLPKPTGLGVTLIPAQRPTRIARGESSESVPDLIREVFGNDGAKAVRVAACESGTSPTSISSSGRYRGLFQADADFWASYGGLSFAARPELASAREQTLVAYRGFLAHSWAPWPRCGRR